MKGAGVCPPGFVPIYRAGHKDENSAQGGGRLSRRKEARAPVTICISSDNSPSEVVHTIPETILGTIPSNRFLPALTPRELHKERQRKTDAHKSIQRMRAAGIGTVNCNYPECACSGVNGAQAVQCTESSTGQVMCQENISQMTSSAAEIQSLGEVLAGPSDAVMPRRRVRTLRRGGASVCVKQGGAAGEKEGKKQLKRTVIVRSKLPKGFETDSDFE